MQVEKRDPLERLRDYAGDHEDDDALEWLNEVEEELDHQASRIASLETDLTEADDEIARFEQQVYANTTVADALRDYGREHIDAMADAANAAGDYAAARALREAVGVMS